MPAMQFLVPGALVLGPMGSPEDLTRFAEAFHKAWRKIGDAGFAEDQQALVAYWAQGGCPSLVQLDDSSLWDQRLGPGCAKGQGRVLRFDSGRLFSLPAPDSLVLVIAHEVAHAYLFARRDPIHWQEPPADRAEFEQWDAERERLAEETLRRWGFDVEEHRLLLKHATKRGSPEPTTPGQQV